MGGMIPDDIRPGTECDMMRGFSEEVTPCVLFGGLPGLELQEREARTFLLVICLY